MRGFSDEERERIREELKEAGRDLFAQYGLGKTTVAELTDPVGIGTSTFYQFYDSKDALYRAVLEEEEATIAERIERRSFSDTDNPRDAMAEFLRVSFEEIETNPLVERIIVEDERDRLQSQYTDQERAAEREQELSLIRPYVEQWQGEGEIREGNPDAIAGAVRAVVLLTLHREDIGENYETVRDTLIEIVADGLVAN